jgi:cell division protein FtsN
VILVKFADNFDVKQPNASSTQYFEQMGSFDNTF